MATGGEPEVEEIVDSESKDPKGSKKRTKFASGLFEKGVKDKTLTVL